MCWGGGCALTSKASASRHEQRSVRSGREHGSDVRRSRRSRRSGDLGEQAENTCSDRPRMRCEFPALDVVPYVADILKNRVCIPFSSANSVQCVNAAAHKHVPRMEPKTREAIKNTSQDGDRRRRLPGVCLAKMVMISTTRRVNPTSSWAAPARGGDVRAGRTSAGERVVTVRFASAGSSGSVVRLQEKDRGGRDDTAPIRNDAVLHDHTEAEQLG